MKPDELDLDNIFGEEGSESNDSFVEASENEYIDQKEASENEHTKEEDIQPVLKTINLPFVTKPTDEGYMPYLFKLPGFASYKRGVWEGEDSLKNEFTDTEFMEYGDLLRAQTTIRNRKSAGSSGLESNSRLNRWSDGSWTLQIGSEHFEVLPQSFMADENSLLYVRHQKESCMEEVGRLANKLTVRPFMNANSGSHRKYFALAEATGKGMKQTKVRVATTIVDPEREKQHLIKMQQERIKARRKLDAKKRNLDQRAYDRVGRTGLSARFLEADEDEGGSYDNEDQDEYEADFIDDAEIEDADEEASGDEIKTNPPSKNTQSSDSASLSRTSRLIFDDDEDDN